MGKSDSLSGIYADDGDAYLDDCMKQVAYEVAAQLERDGYTVTNQPPYTGMLYTAKRRIEDCRRALATY